jgi:lipooligosaccharide transport system ATP-binding protein
VSGPGAADSAAAGSAAADEGLVVARGLRKSYGSFEAVRGIDLTVRRGEAFGVLGPNGAGKSSTMRMLGCVSPPSGGTLRVFGRDPVREGPAIRARLGVVPQDDTLDQELSVRDNMVVYGRYFDLPWRESRRRCAELLDFVHLAEWAGARVETLSGGMKRRLTIARALVNEPDLLLLDEPTTGLDPQARHAVWDRLYRLKQGGVTLLLTTHYMDEAEQLCDRVVVMHHGRIAAAGSPRELIDEYVTREVVELRFDGADAQWAADGRLDGSLADLAARVEVLPDRVLLYSDDGDAAAAAAADRLPVPPASTLVRRAGLEDVFLRLTGRTLVD